MVPEMTHPTLRKARGLGGVRALLAGWDASTRSEAWFSDLLRLYVQRAEFELYRRAVWGRQ